MVILKEVQAQFDDCAHDFDKPNIIRIDVSDKAYVVLNNLSEARSKSKTNASMI